jgi:hypothetical protein
MVRLLIALDDPVAEIAQRSDIYEKVTGRRPVAADPRDAAFINSAAKAYVENYRLDQFLLENSQPEALGTDSVYSYALWVEPIDVNIQMNSSRTPNQATVTLATESLPINPRTTTTMGVEIYMGAVDPVQVRTRSESGEHPDLDPSHMLLLHAGVAKTIRWDEDSRQITIDAPDFSDMLMGTKMPPKLAATLNLDEDLVSVIGQIVGDLPATRDMIVLWDDLGTDIDSAPRVVGSSVVAAGATKQPPKPSGSRPTKSLTGRRPYLKLDAGISYWDAITDLSVGTGCTARVHLDTIIVSPSSAFYGPDAARKQMLTDSVLTFSKYHNIENAQLERELGRRDLAGVEVLCWDPIRRVTLRALFPDRGKRKKGEKRILELEGTVETIIVSGVSDLATLEVIATGAFYEMQRQMITGSFITRDTHALDDESQFGSDHLKLRPGDTIRITPSLPVWAYKTRIEANKAVGELDRAILQDDPYRTGYDIPEPARRLLGQTPPPYSEVWVVSAQHSWSAEEGYSLAVSFSDIPIVRGGGISASEVLLIGARDGEPAVLQDNR